MKTINIAQLKSQLSAYLRLVRSGEQIIVLDRRQPVAQILPLDREQGTTWETLARAGSIRLGTQDWSSLRIKPLRRKIAGQLLLTAVRSEQ